jgi:hypothetical protein
MRNVGTKESNPSRRPDGIRTSCRHRVTRNVGGNYRDGATSKPIDFDWDRTSTAERIKNGLGWLNVGEQSHGGSKGRVQGSRPGLTPIEPSVER